MFHLFRDLIKSRVSIDLAFGRLEKLLLLAGIAGVNIDGSHYPNTDTLISPRIDVTRVLYCHRRVWRMQATDMFVGQSILASNENFPKWPVVHCFSVLFLSSF